MTHVVLQHNSKAVPYSVLCLQSVEEAVPELGTKSRKLYFRHGEANNKVDDEHVQ